jgi:tight adherence protein B
VIALVACAAAAAAVATVSGRRAAARRRLLAAFGATDGAGEGRGSLVAAGAVGLAGLLLVHRGAVAPIAILIGVAGVGSLVARRRATGRDGERRRAAVIEAVFAMSAELRAGATPAQAIHAAATGAGPLRAGLAAVAGALRAGAAPAPELRGLAETPDCGRLRHVAAAWEVSDRSGAQIADVLDRLGAAFDADESVARELAAMLSGPRATMTLLAGLPALGIALGESVGAHPLALLVHRPLGWALMAAAAGLDTLGLLWTARIVRGAVPR